MPNKNTCVLLYSSLRRLEQDISKLQAHDFDIRTVSIICSRQKHKSNATGLSAVGEQTQSHGYPTRKQGDEHAKLKAVSNFTFHEFGTMAAAGPIVHLLMKVHQGTDSISGLSMLASALFDIGIPMDSIRQYEKSVNAEKFLLIIHGSRNDIEHACQLLHSETQQVTVHMA